MFNTLLSQLLSFPIAQKSLVIVSIKWLIYILIIIGLVWLSIANYYFFLSNYQHSFGAFISSIAFFVIASILAIYNCYIKRKLEQENIFHLIASETGPLIENSGKSIKELLKNRNLRTILVVASTLTILYKIFNKK